jgi:signal transduction histidine kinase
VKKWWSRVRALDPFVVDSALALALLALILGEVATKRPSAKDATWTTLFMLTQTLPLAYRRRRPFVVLNVVGISAILYNALNIAPQPYTELLPVLLAIYTTSAYGTRAQAAYAGLTGLAAVVGLNAATPSKLDYGQFVTQGVFVAATWLVGDNVRQRRTQSALLEERAERAEREREERAQLAALEERSRIAREIHDIVAHSVSVVAVQAGAARRVVKQDPARAEEVISRIETVSRDALSELRRLLGVLRSSDERPAFDPQPGLDRLDQLVDQFRLAGLSVEVEMEGERPVLPPSLDLSIYRVVQEALTNSLRHGGATSSRVRIRFDQGEIAVEVADRGGEAEAKLPSSGQGLIGMRERVAMFGGTIEAAPSNGGFTVRARFPVPEAQEGH